MAQDAVREMERLTRQDCLNVAEKFVVGVLEVLADKDLEPDKVSPLNFEANRDLARLRLETATVLMQLADFKNDHTHVGRRIEVESYGR